jgi:hydrogenase nickel incorporation protein HypB
MFRKADLVLLTKLDLLRHLDGVSLDAYVASLERVMPRLRVLTVSATTGSGVLAFTRWLERLREEMLPALPTSA